MIVRFLLLLGFCGACIYQIGPACVAQSPSLDLIEPSVVTRGQTAKVRALGAAVGRCTQALLPIDGFKVVEIKQVDHDTVDLFVEVLTSCKLGLHPIRFASSHGITEVRGLTVTPFETVSEELARNNLDVSKNRTILGTLEGDEVDRFTVDLQEGQWLCAEISAVRLGGKLLDTAMILTDSNGVKIIEVDDTALTAQDPFFSFQAAKTGRYELAVKAIGADADSNSRYALHLGHFPRPARAVPLGVSSNQAWRFGQNTSGFSADRLVAQSTSGSKSAIEQVELSARTIDGSTISCPTLLPIRVSPEEYQSSLSDRDLQMAPFAFETSLVHPTSNDGIPFRVPADDVYQVEVYASRLGSSLDATLEIREEQTGASIASAEDIDSLDASIVFAGKAGKTYLVRVDDKRSMRGEDYFYRLEVGPKKPDLTAFISRRDKLSQAHQSIGVPQGNRVLTMVGLRSDTDHQQIALEPKCDAAGLEFKTVPFTQIRRIRPMIVSAGADAPLGWGKTKVVPVTTYPKEAFIGEGVESQGPTLRGDFLQVLDLIRGPADALYLGMQLDHFMMGVVEPVPISVDLLPFESSLCVDGTLKVDGTVHRLKRSDGTVFDGAIDVFVSHLPEGVVAPVQIRIPKGVSNFSIELQATLQAPLEQWPLVVEASEALTNLRDAEPQIGAIDSAVGSWASNSSLVCSSIQTLNIVSNPAKGKLDPIAIEAGETREVTLEIELDTPFDGPFEACVEGLPNRVESGAVLMQAVQRKVDLRIETPEDAPLGRFDSVFVRLKGKRKGQEVSHCICRSTVLVVAAKGQLVTDSQGRPLSPLDALRQKSKANR